MKMLLTLARIRHNASGSATSSSPGGTAAHRSHKNNNNQKNALPLHDNKYTKSPTSTSTSNTANSTKSCCARLQYWSWIVCGFVCAFMSIDYSVHFFARESNASGASSTSSANVDVDSILTPLRSVGSSLTPPPPNPAQPPPYAFDNTALTRADPLQHALLIPYRDRQFHLDLFLEYMGPYLDHHFPNATFTLWVIEQDDAELFNRAWLANVGLRHIVQHAPTTSCVIFHDVDLVPNMTSHVPYTTCQYPTQLGSELQHFNWTVPYPAYCGGITSLSLKHWQLINGLGNDYIGWGGEDDDLYHRLRQNGLLYQPTGRKDLAPVPRRPPKGRGVFRTISQRAEHHEQKKTHNQYWKTLELLKQMHENSDRWKFDGMTDAYYTVTGWKTTQPELGIAQYHHIKAIPQKLRNGNVLYHKHNNNNNNNNPVNSATAAAAAAAASAAKDEKPTAPLEFIHVPYTGGQAITKAAAKAGIVWGACHYAPFVEWDCPPQGSGDFQHSPIHFQASYQQALTPWLIPTHNFLENPLEGTKRFTVVRHPYSRAISFYRYTYDKQHGHPHGFKYHDLCGANHQKDHPPLAVAQYLRDREHPAKLNAFLQQFLIREHHPHKPDGIALIPQVNFVYYRGVKYVHHVLHYEFLQRDFKNILEKYDMTGLIELPPPERKRKRKKQVVKAYDEKRIPKTTSWTRQFFGRPLRRLLGLVGLGGGADATTEPPPVVDMSLAEIEDEYLLGAQDLANETIAMLNSHFELDFRKFHYAKIKVNATTDAYWNPIQVIPRESSVAKQQSNRNNAMNKQKTGGGEAPAAAVAKKDTAAEAKTKTTDDAPRSSQKTSERLKDLSDGATKKKKKITDKLAKNAEEKGQDDGGEPDNFDEMKARFAKRLQDKKNLEAEATQDKESDGKVDSAEVIRNMRQMAEELTKEKESQEQEQAQTDV